MREGGSSSLIPATTNLRRMASSSPPPQNDSNGTRQRARGGVVARYRTTLAALSARTGTSLPALVTSFAVLHEATAIGPLIGVFYACRTFGVGERVVGYMREAGVGSGAGESWAAGVGERWMTEGEQWAGRVGRRYGIWGFEKGSKAPAASETSASSSSSTIVAGDVANALVAYCATKVRHAIISANKTIKNAGKMQALLPVRIGASLYFAPGFARRVVVPVGRAVFGDRRGR